MSDIEIHVHSHTKNFTIVANEVINHPKLSMDAKFLLIWCTSKPESWKLNTLGLAKTHNISRNKVSAISKELQDNHYLIISKGKNGYTKWLFFGTKYDHEQYISSQKLVETIKKSSTDPVLTPNPHSRDVGLDFDDPQYDDHRIGDALVSTDLNKKNCTKDLPSNEFEEVSEVEFIFSKLWHDYPKKQAKQDAFKAFKKFCKGQTTSWMQNFQIDLSNDIVRRKLTPQWSDKQYIPQCSRYLNARLFEDELIYEPKKQLKGLDKFIALSNMSEH